MPTRGIPFPAGDPSLEPDEERAWRQKLLERELDASKQKLAAVKDEIRALRDSVKSRLTSKPSYEPADDR